ncbi:hypothetical protein ACFX13_046387 [Malus domestica]
MRFATLCSFLADFVPCSSAKEWFLWVLQTKQSIFDFICMLVWHIWQARNDHIWNGKNEPPSLMAQIAVAWMQEFQVVDDRARAVQQLVTGAGQWAGGSLMDWEMADNWVRVVDGATKLQARVGGTGVVVCDAHGGFVATMTCFLPNVSLALLVELLAIKHRVDLAQQLGFQKVQVKSDSFQAMSIVNFCVDRASAMDLLAGYIIFSVASFTASKFIYISRNNNGIAHCLAKVVVSSGTRVVWIEEPLSVIFDLLIQEMV